MAETTHPFRTLQRIGLGGKTVLPGKPVELTEKQAATLIANGSIALPESAAPALRDALADISAEELEKHLAGLKLEELKSLAASLNLEAATAKTKAEFSDLIKAAHKARAEV